MSDLQDDINQKRKLLNEALIIISELVIKLKKSEDLLLEVYNQSIDIKTSKKMYYYFNPIDNQTANEQKPF